MRRTAAVLLTLAALASCNKPPVRPAVERVALPPFENLSGDPSLDWIRTAAPAVLAAALEPGGKTVIARVASRRETGEASLVIHGRVEKWRQSISLVTWKESLPDTRQSVTVRSVGNASSGLAALLLPIAKSIDPGAAAVAASDDALRAYAAGDPVKAAELAPAFWPAYEDGAAMLAAQRKVPEALTLIRSATSVPEGPQRRLSLLEARLEGNRDKEVQATGAIATQPGASWQTVSTYASLLLQQRSFAEAIAQFERASRLNPQSKEILSALGYSQTYAGDVAAAQRVFEKYRTLVPNDPNGWDSAGDAHYYHGKFADAEKAYLKSAGMDPRYANGASLYKAAVSKRKLGDEAGARKHIERLADLHPATKKLLFTVWDEHAKVAEATRRAILAASNAPQLLTLFLRERYAEALPLAQRQFETSNPNDDRLARVLLAACLNGTGKKDEANKLLAVHPAPRWPVQQLDPVVDEIEMRLRK